jgi:hypothetical protein
MKKFAYVFTCGSRVEWSSETPASLLVRLINEPDKVQYEVADFMKGADRGSFMRLPTGEMIFCTETA